MKINGRLLLILCAVALFIHLWNVNDRRPTRAALTGSAAVRDPRKSETRQPMPPLHRTATKAVPLPARADLPMPGGEEIWTAQSAPFQLPKGLPAGAYRVVSESGRVARLTIDATVNGTEKGGAPDFLAISTASDRWYVIRLKASSGRPSFSTAWNDRLPSVPDIPLPPTDAMPNRKFDFSGYAAPEPIEAVAPAVTVEAAIEQAERPSPPELPSPL